MGRGSTERRRGILLYIGRILGILTMIVIPSSATRVDVTLYTRPISTFGLIAEVALVEKGVPFELIDVDTTSEEHRERHPFGKIPVLDHRLSDSTFRLFESVAIARYIDEAFAGPALQPADPRARASMTQWILTVKAYLFPTMSEGISKPRLFVGDVPADEQAIAAATVEAGRQLALVERALESTSWLVGDGLTLADVFLFPVLGALSLTPEGERLLVSYPGCAAWLATMQARESVRTTGVAARAPNT